VFAEHAIVRDEGQTYRGLAAIKQWKAEAKKKYQYTIEPLASARKGDKTIVTSRLTGNFPAAPSTFNSSSGSMAARSCC